MQLKTYVVSSNALSDENQYRNLLRSAPNLSNVARQSNKTYRCCRNNDTFCCFVLLRLTSLELTEVNFCIDFRQITRWKKQHKFPSGSHLSGLARFKIIQYNLILPNEFCGTSRKLKKLGCVIRKTAMASVYIFIR